MAKRGRPTKTPTQSERAKVKELLAEKAPLADIAKLMGLSVPTLRKYFQAEIFSGKKINEPATPSRKVTDAQREKVKRYIGCKMSPRDVARAIGYEQDDDYAAFLDDFAHEMAIGAAVYRAKVLDRLDEQMTGGLAGATNKLEALTQLADTDSPAGAGSGGYIGKKVAAQADAAAAVASGGKFAPRAAPKLVANGGRRIDDPSPSP